MKTPLQLSVRHLTLSDPARALVHRYVEKLERFYDRITSCRVMIEVPQSFPTGEPVVYHVRVDIRVPGEEIVIKRQQHSELETAIQEAFDCAGRRLQDYAQRQRGEGKRPARASADGAG
jgi:ribosome-associated translation inhibitor RaiA